MNPRGYPYPVVLRTWIQEGIREAPVVGDPLRPPWLGNPNLPLYPSVLRTWAPHLNPNIFPPVFTVGAADFEPSACLIRGAPLVGVTDSKSGSLVLWIRLDAGDGVRQIILSSGSGEDTQLYFQFERNAANKFELDLRMAGGVQLASLVSSDTYVAGAQWYLIQMSWDLNGGNAANSHMRINRLDKKTAPVFTDGTIRYAFPRWKVGRDYDDSFTDPNFCLAEYWFAPGQFIDFSVLANQQKFVYDNGTPKPLGVDGSIPTGSPPAIYFHLDNGEDPADFRFNRAPGGVFLLGGALTACATNPSYTETKPFNQNHWPVTRAIPRLNTGWERSAYPGSITEGAKPIVPIDWPNPRGYIQAALSWVSTPYPGAIPDQPKPFPPFSDFQNPRGAQFPISLRTLLNPSFLEEPPAPPAIVELRDGGHFPRGGARFEWYERRQRVRKRLEREEVIEEVVEAVLAEIEELPTDPSPPQLAAAIARIVSTLGPSWEERYHAILESEIRPVLKAAAADELTDSEVAAIVLLLLT